MKETISLIFHGCNLAKDLETSLPNLANLQPGILSKSCDEIVKVFVTARDRLNALDSIKLYPQAVALPLQQPQYDPSLHEWLKSGFTQTMEHVMQTRILAAGRSPFDINERDLEGSSSLFRGTQAMDHVPDSGRPATTTASSSSQRPRRRKDGEERRTVQVPAPQIGNTDIPPEDGYTWRKYGQKEILGSKFPRSYYRCTHQKLYQCPAKKQVQRLDDNPFTFEVLYRGQHSCHMSSTAPSVPPPPSLEVTQEMTQTIGSQPSTTLAQWLSMEYLGAGGRSSTAAAGGDGAGPSTVRYGKEADYLLADMVDAMFNNSGSSSTNSMDLIFPSVEDHKWDSDDKLP
ncbi:WRKY domain-containing protein [Cephalotus follicularis]|uniref:WRKY domain-containing protein n=1 Tax=Cephalotus follicularis TaxID=3775 RepID=A0A1Q3BIS5_CEPFO|nr:WRKY domain-containing protein [Cephalotus follicularis]